LDGHSGIFQGFAERAGSAVTRPIANPTGPTISTKHIAHEIEIFTVAFQIEPGRFR
jgi:hypothetical protein